MLETLTFCVEHSSKTWSVVGSNPTRIIYLCTRSEENLFSCKITATVIELRSFMKKQQQKKKKNL